MKEFTRSLLNEMLQTMLDGMVKQGIDKELAYQVAYNTVDMVRKNFGGVPLQIPRDIALDKILRNSRILADFTGNNHEALALKHNLSTQQIYRIIEEARVQHSRANYGDQATFDME
ncbi:Mor transcription activator family protein [Bowmanella denitrificans]|uniref:Mor transcription activator family protein n=1 Tax=Bowmanella denitrificans TaxID=366582 RepID=UPI001559FF91|nr:Mor transcription activator family protein [Bowmanella denitrificans]